MRLVLHLKDCEFGEMKGSSGLTLAEHSNSYKPHFSPQYSFLFFGSQTSSILKPVHYGLSKWGTLQPILHADSLSLSGLWFGCLPKRRKTNCLGWQRTVSVWVALRMQLKGFQLSPVLKGLLEILTAQLVDFLCALKILSGGSSIAFFHWLCSSLRGDLLKSKLSH